MSTTTAPAAASPLSAPPSLPAGYLAIPVFPDHLAAPLRLCVVARKDADPVAGHFVVLRTLLDAVVYLGSITDQGSGGARGGGRLHGYVEIWVQSLKGLAASPAAVRETLSNRVLDDRWTRQFKAFEALDALPESALYRSGFETTAPRPLFYDIEKREMVQPVDAFSNSPWKLCTDDARLTAKSLPPYSASLDRYLSADEKSPLIPITENAPTNSSTAPLTEITGPKNTLFPFNPGGLMLFRRYAPIALEAFFDLLSGGTWEGILAGRSAVHLDGLSDALEEKGGSAGGADMADGRLFLGKHGKWGRLIESFHLKLRLLADCFSEVRALTAQMQRPLLNLSARSFQADIGAGPRAHALPFLWTATATLVDPGDAVTLKMESSDAQYFLRGTSDAASVYQPESVSRPATGQGTLRIRKTMAEPTGLILEATFATHEKMGAAQGSTGPAKNDLVWLRVPVGSQRVDLYGHVEKEPALAAGEWRFRTERQRLPEPVIAQLKAAEGVPIPETQFDIVPMLSVPCDLYSLAILAARALLVNGDITLAIVADELISLARQIGAQHDPKTSLSERIRAIFQSDPRWLSALGPQRLTRETLTPQEAFDLIPANLWFDTLGLLVRMLPAMGPDSICRDFGDAPRGGFHKIYDPAISALDTLLVRTRSLIVIDWRFNREIHSVLRKFPVR